MNASSAPTTPAEIARVFTEAWTRQDLDTAARYLADDVTFDGPANHLEGKQAYIEGLGAFARAVSGLNILAVLGDETQALIMYEAATGPFGTLTCAELLRFRDGKIATDLLTYDTFPMRQARAGQPPAAPVAPAE